MVAEAVRHPLLALGLFMALAMLLYHWSGRVAPQGGSSSARRSPYACGQDLLPSGERLSYKVFFRLALMFIVVHIAALISMLLPLLGREPAVATLYLLGTGVCVDILTRGGD
jgi:NADH:ubiquinone oxidoreductase subunit 3 (subunit A)